MAHHCSKVHIATCTAVVLGAKKLGVNKVQQADFLRVIILFCWKILIYHFAGKFLRGGIIQCVSDFLINETFPVKHALILLKRKKKPRHWVNAAIEPGFSRHL
jgi:hypothetical protein